MATTNFTAGTVVASSWLNDVNFYTYNQATEKVPLLKYVPVTEWSAIQSGTSTYDCKNAFASARAECEALPKGGVVSLPMGTVPVSYIDWTNDDPANFYKQLGITGAGRFASRIVPLNAGEVLLNMAGRNHAHFSDFQIDSSSLASQCAIFMCRTTTSGNANNNTFNNVWITGSYTKAGVVSIAAESTDWNNCRFENTNSAAKYTTFFTSTRNTEIAVLPGYGASSIEGPNTDNTMRGCEFYSPFGNISPCEILVFSRAAGYSMHGCTVIGYNSAGSANCKGVVYRNPITGVFNGPIEWHGCHFEIIGTDNCVVHYLDGSGSSWTLEGLQSFGGHYVVGPSMSLVDFNRTLIAEQPILRGAVWTPFKAPPGSTGLSLNCYVLSSSDVSFRSSQNDGVIYVSGFCQNSRIEAASIMQSNQAALGSTINKVVTALPTTGTYTVGENLIRETPVVGQPTGWKCTVSGTLGTLNGGATTGTISNGSNVLTLSSATGTSEGQRITVAGAGGPFYIRKLVGTTAYLDNNASASVVAAAVGFSSATLVALPTL